MLDQNNLIKHQFILTDKFHHLFRTEYRFYKFCPIVNSDIHNYGTFIKGQL